MTEPSILGALRRLLRGPAPAPVDRGRFEEDLERALAHDPSLGRGGTILEVGAGQGRATALLAARVERPYTVVSFEPEPEAARALKASLREAGLEGRVQLFDAAVAGEETMAQLRVDEGRGRDHRLTAASEDGRKVAVVGIRLDAHLGRSGLTRVALLVADVAGQEPEVLSSLSGHPLPVPFFIAYRPEALRRGGHDPEDVLEALGRGHELRWLDGALARPTDHPGFAERVRQEGGVGVLGRPRPRGRSR